MKPILKLLIALSVMVNNVNCTSSHNESRIRPAAVAGQFYPADADTLRAEINGYMTPAQTPAQTNIQAIIVPHAGYVFSGATAGRAFSLIDTAANYKRVFLLGPSHRAAFDAVSVDTEYDAYATPLGNVPLDTAVCHSLTESDTLFAYLPKAHEGEHCLEVQLPFLQTRLKNVPPVVPLIVGTQDINKLSRAADVLRPYFTADNLFIISSDFSHYPNYDDAVTVDSATGKALESASLDAFISALNDNSRRHIRNLYTSACGQAPIAVLLMLLQNEPDVSIEHLGYCNSDDSPYGGHDRVVGYHAFAAVRHNSAKDKTETDGRFALDDREKATLLSLARQTIADSLAGRPEKVVDTTRLTPSLKAKCGAFVTLNIHGRLRGCIGNLVGRRPLYATIQAMALAAAFEDPRFTPVTESELNDIDIEISVLSPLKRIHSADELQLGRHGIFMVNDGRSGTFLPQVAEETGWTREEFLGHCSRDKAGLGWDGWRNADLYVYEADVFGEKQH